MAAVYRSPFHMRIFNSVACHTENNDVNVVHEAVVLPSDCINWCQLNFRISCLGQSLIDI